ncbi:MAG: 50S ribosomal protein L25/general stress protein Ctc [Betaproteobacteria bacterium]|nr:50S ribosomal protein L25/general stress protein Ctc [Betaproteobacteria bacterium]
MKIAFKAETRKGQGTGASRRLRRADRVPGIVYGADKPASVIELDHKDLYINLKKEAFHASILDMELDGKSEQVLLRDVQMHPFKKNVLHVDFQRVDANKKIHMKVPLHFINEEISPGVKQSGGIASHIVNELDITCLPKDLPEFITVDLKDLSAGHTLHLSGLKMPAGVTAVTHRGEDPSIATIIIPRAVVAEEETAPAVAAADVPAANQKAKEEEAPKKDDKGGKDKK